MKRPFLNTVMVMLLVLINVSCSKEEPDMPANHPGFLDDMSFGKMYQTADGGDILEYMVVDANAQSIELRLYDKRKNYAPVDTFNVKGILNYHEIHDLEIRSMSDVNLSGTDWWGRDPNATPDLNSIEYAELGDGETIHHTFGWFNLQHVKTEDEPQKIIVTIPENTTGQIRGLRIYAGIQEHLGNLGNIQIFQLPKEDEVSEYKSRFPMKIRYKGQLYASMAEIDENGEYHYDNPEFAEMMNFIDSTPDIDAVIVDNITVDYYDTDDPVYQEFLNSVNRPIDPTLTLSPVSTTIPKTRADGFEHWTSGSIGYYAAFSDGEFQGDYLTFTPKNMHNSHNLRDLKMNSMNDKISSVAVYYGGDQQNVCAVLTVWENGNYNNDDNNIPRKKHRISFIASYYNRKISRNSLKNVKLINASGSWNDRISALSFHFAYLDRPLKDY